MAGAASLGGCATPSPPGARPAPLAERSSEPVDGRYRGIARLVRAHERGCPRSGNRLVTVEGDALTVPYRGARASYGLVATVAPDGTVSGHDGRGSIEGRITGRHMDLTVSSDVCVMRYELDRS